MVPAHLMVLGQFPLTPNGKVDRRALPSPELKQSLSKQYAAPRTYIEEELAAIFAETLGVERVGVHDSFFELGGHSLLVTRAIFRIREVFHLELPMRALFEAPTVAGLGRHLESLRPGHRGLTIPNIVPEPREGPLPLSFAQQRLWFLGQLLPDAPSYNEPVTVRFRGSVDPEALSRALTEIVNRHEVWRTSFHVTQGEPVQVIHSPKPLPLPIADLRALPKQEREAAFMQRCTEEAHRPFDLVNGPLVRFVLLIVDDEDARLFLTFHHIIADGLSIYGVFNVELAKLYRAFCAGEKSPLPPLPVQYLDYTIWQRRWLSSELIERQLSYWKKQLAAPLPRLQLPEDHAPPPNPTFRGGRELVSVPLALTQTLRRLGHSEGATLFITLLTALKALFYRYIEQQEVVVGIVTAGRQRPELAPLLGFFPNTLVLRTEMSGTLSFRELLRRVREVTLSAFDNQDVPFERVVEACNPERHPGETPLFRVGFILDPATPELGVDWAMTSLDVELDAAKFDLSLELVEVPHGLVGRFGYRSELFDSSTIARMAGHYVTLLAGIADNPDQSVAKLPLLTATERAALTSWSAPTAPFPDGPCIHELFTVQVDRAPDQIALHFEGQELSYRQLDEAANRVSHALLAEGIHPEEIVGVCVERSPRLIIAMLGILKAGGAFLILDPTYPKDRLELLAKDANLALLLSESALSAKLPTPRTKTLLFDEGSWQVQPNTRLEPRSTARSLAYVIYTSGSTGQPKGVLIEHRGLCSVITAQIERFGLGPHSRVLQLASLSFDATLYEVFNALFCGGTLVLAPRDKLLPGPALTTLLSEQRITMLTITPSVLAVLPVAPLPYLTTLVIAGEALPLSLVSRWASPQNGRHIWNAYGPTEATICASLGECTLTDDPPPIGTVVANSEIHLLDANLQPVPVGIPGEICIGGVAIARGYLNRPELTEERFITSPVATRPGQPPSRLYRSGDLGRFRADGRLEYLSRIDHQVKIRGFRIEPGEIEAALRLCPGVSDAAVVAASQPDGSKELVAYVVPSGTELASPSTLRSQLQSGLPDFMIPSAYVALPVLPQTANGKVDRQALAKRQVQPQRTHVEYQAPKSDLEQQISQVWREVLHVDRVGLADNFFDLGGHSLKMAQVHARLREVLGKEVSLLTLFQYPSIGALTAFLTGNAQVESEDTARSQERGRLRKEAAALQRQRAQGRKQRDE